MTSYLSSIVVAEILRIRWVFTVAVAQLTVKLAKLVSLRMFFTQRKY